MEGNIISSLAPGGSRSRSWWNFIPFVPPALARTFSGRGRKYRRRAPCDYCRVTRGRRKWKLRKPVRRAVGILPTTEFGRRYAAAVHGCTVGCNSFQTNRLRARSANVYYNGHNDEHCSSRYNKILWFAREKELTRTHTLRIKPERGSSAENRKRATHTASDWKEKCV